MVSMVSSYTYLRFIQESCIKYKEEVKIQKIKNKHHLSISESRRRFHNMAGQATCATVSATHHDCSPLPDVVTRDELASTLFTNTDRLMRLFEAAMEAQVKALQRILHESTIVLLSAVQQPQTTSSQEDVSTVTDQPSMENSQDGQIRRSNRIPFSINITDPAQIPPLSPTDLRNYSPAMEKQMTQAVQTQKEIINQTIREILPQESLVLWFRPVRRLSGNSRYPLFTLFATACLCRRVGLWTLM